MRTFDYAHVDVFADRQLQGNGLSVVFCHEKLTAGQMLDLAREFKQFETIFLSGWDDVGVDARIFTVDGELPFAGHPVLGGAAALHARVQPEKGRLQMQMRLPGRAVPVVSERTETGFCVEMRQGPPAFLGEVPKAEVDWLLAAHSLPGEALDASLPVEVVSTGLPYVIIPVTGALAQAHITVRDLERRIAAYGASYTYLLNTRTLQARTWDNLGLVEDTATGSAAGPSCAYLVRHGRVEPGATVEIRQGEYANRPGRLLATMRDGEVYVSGGVVLFAQGAFTIP